MSSERRERLTEAFTGARDGALAAQLGGRKAFGGAGLPSYALPDPGTVPMKTDDDLFRDFGHLVRPRGEEIH